jgi:hypothetical protein
VVAGDPREELAHISNGRPIVLRHRTVLTMNDDHDVLHDADVLVVGDMIAGIGPGLEVPEGALEIDASRGAVMPGMIDTHRHMWQTALRGYGADWTLSQYFVFFYLEWGKIFRPQDIYAGNLLSAIESLNAGVTTTVDWSHGLDRRPRRRGRRCPPGRPRPLAAQRSASGVSAALQLLPTVAAAVAGLAPTRLHGDSWQSRSGRPAGSGRPGAR